ncbi:MAG: rRNA maturation RNase YbeY [Myxococcota bacterium]
MKTPRLFRALGLADPELSVLLTGNDHIQRLNHQWRNEDKPTDVLSFPLHEPPSPGDFAGDIFALGDIVISVEYAEKTLESGQHRRRVAQELEVDAQSLDWDLEDEVMFLVIHGLLHLIGHDHARTDDEAAMKAEERRLWAAVRH